MMHYPLIKSQEHAEEDDAMSQHLELVMKRDLAPGWRHAFEKVRVFFAKKSEVDSKEKTEETDWRDRVAKNWYY